MGWVRLTKSQREAYEARAGLVADPPVPVGRWFVPEVARYLGVKDSTVIAYRSMSAARAREGRSRPGDLPQPDGRVFARSGMWWRPGTIINYVTGRPGQGAGGGRPVGWRKPRRL